MTFFRHVYFPNPPKLVQTDINGKRHYIDPTGSVLQKGVALPSVTTVLNLLSQDGINSWRKRVGEKKADEIMHRASTNGTDMHTIIEYYLDNKATESVTNKTSRKLFEQLKPELNKINNIRAQEVQLYSTKLGVAGRVDCLAEYDGVLSVIDFKSTRARKKKEWITKYFLQATCYALMIEELTKVKSNQIVIMLSGEDESVEVHVEKTEDYKDRLLGVLEDYKLRVEFEV